MTKFLRGKIINLFKVLIGKSPFCVATSMLFKGLFLLTQVVSIGVIISWALGSVNPMFVEIVGSRSDSILYPIFGALGFVVSAVFSLLSKIFALKSTLVLEEVIINKSIKNNINVVSGDLKNMVKLMVAIIDNVVPIFLLFCVSLVWAYIVPLSVVVIIILLFLWVWFLRSWTRHSAKKYRQRGKRVKIDEYMHSAEHKGFYGVLILPNYISISLMTIISITVVFSLAVAKVSISSDFDFSTYLLLATGIAIIQTKSFVGVIQRAGAYSTSLSKVYDALSISVEP